MKKNYKNILIAFILMLSFGAIWFFGYKYFQKSVILIREDYQTFYENQRVKDNINDIRFSYQKIKPDIDSVNGYFITKDEEVRFIENIESLARENKLEVEISSINIEKDQNIQKDGLEYLVIKVNTRGSWEGTYKFFGLIEMMPYHIFINKFSISKQDDDVKNKNLKGFFEIYTTRKI